MIKGIEELSGCYLTTEREARVKIKNYVPGMGWKTSSDFLKDIGFSKYLAVLDSRNLKFLQLHGLAPKTFTQEYLSRKRIYYYLEDIENELARRLRITVSELDERIMSFGEERLHLL